MIPQSILGAWKCFEFVQVQEQHFSQILLFLRETFYKDEPIKALTGMSEDRVSDLDNRILPRLRDGTTLIAVDKMSAEFHIAGVIIIAGCPKDKDWNLPQPISPLTNIVTPFLVELEASVDIYNKYGVDNYADIFIVSVSKEFTGHGLGTELLRRSLDWIKEMDYKMVQAVFTNPASRRMGDKLGFIEVSRRYLHDAVDEVGTKTMPNAGNDLFATATVLDLRK